ncbi:3754_t:CDS:2, partial [Paraglomus occultum]
MAQELFASTVASVYLQNLFSTLHNKKHDKPSEILRDTFGFSLKRQESSIPETGIGVYLYGKAKEGDIVSMYPGTIYFSGDPMFLVSLKNSYILKCNNGFFFDGKPYGLSKHIFKSLYKRINYPGVLPTCDISWLERNDEDLKNPLAIGQFVNNGTPIYKANVRYQELEIDSLPISLWKYIPNIHYASNESITKAKKVVVLVATRDIKDEELFSTYID